jgi:hypothetical protein
MRPILLQYKQSLIEMKLVSYRRIEIGTLNLFRLSLRQLLKVNTVAYQERLREMAL